MTTLAEQIRAMPGAQPNDLAKRANLLAHRHEAAADHFGKRKAHCVAADFHRFTAETLRELARIAAQIGGAE